MQPGETITPKNDDQEDGKQVPPMEQTPVTETDHNDHTTDNTWKYSADSSNDDNSMFANIKPVSWTASEFVEHEKNSGWYFIFAGLTALAIAIIYIFTRDLITVIVIAMAAALFGVTARRKPRTLSYQLDQTGVRIGERALAYHEFKSFSVLEEGALSSIQLMPLKRFMPPISLYYPPENEDEIITTLSNYLPHEDRSHDPIDRLMRKVRF